MPGPVRWFRRRRARRDEEAFTRLSRIRALAENTPGAEVVYVRHVYQRARRGTKAVVVRDSTREQCDAWFWWARVKPGQMLAVQASFGWGPHTGRDDVLYVGDEEAGSGIHEVLSANDVARSGRHYDRFFGRTCKSFGIKFET